MQKQSIVIIGAGIGGLTAAALLSRRGHQVQVFEQAWIPGGCASTFRRKGFVFDVGATQVAGLEPGGIHHRIFEDLEMDLPPARPCDPACAVYLPGETQPISVWRDREQWQGERLRQFPGSEGFWNLLQCLFKASWRFQSRDPVLPPRSAWDVGQLLQALRPDTLVTVPHTFQVVTDALTAYGLGDDRRLRSFLDLQLKLYSQVDASATALLYAATALSVSQAPQGLFHLEGSMQVLSDRLVAGLKRWGGELYCGKVVSGILTEHNGRTGRRGTGVRVTDRKTGAEAIVAADQVVANVTVQNLVQLLDHNPLPRSMGGYARRVKHLPEGSGAFVLYLGVKRSALPDSCPPHLQFLYHYDRPRQDAPDAICENNSLFVSVSQEGDGRAPAGQATIIASSFTDLRQWWQAAEDPACYQALKAEYCQTALDRLRGFFDLSPDTILHQETATPCTFAHYTQRDRGAVGGLSQRRSSFGPFGFATRTPVEGVWLVGDCTHPGEGTAGVSYSAWTVVRQIERESKPV